MPCASTAWTMCPPTTPARPLTANCWLRIPQGACSPGADDKHIATVDADGVALAAIQKLNQKLEAETQSLRSVLEARDRRIGELEERLSTLEKHLSSRGAPSDK